MKNRKVKRIVAVIMACALAAGTCMMVSAAEKSPATKNALRSNGKIHYFEGEDGIIVDSEDLYTLADQLDLFKVRVTKQLGAMHTYLSKSGSGIPLTSADGVYAVHSRPYAGDEVDPLNLDFAAILEGIAVSQSIPTDPSAYGMSAGAKLYKTPEGRLTTSAEGAEPVNIQSASASNLSAGTAAWVNGRLLLGTGEDVAKMAEKNESSGGTGGDTGDFGNGSGMTEHDIKTDYTVTENVQTAFAYVVSSSSDGNDGGSSPVFQHTGGNFIKLLGKKYARNGFNVRVALYYGTNIPAGTVIQGSNGSLFY